MQEKYGGLFIITDKPFYYPGENVTGKIYVNLHTQFPGNELFIKVKGEGIIYIIRENVRFSVYRTVTTGSGKNRRTRRVEDFYRGNKTIFRNKIPIYKFADY